MSNSIIIFDSRQHKREEVKITPPPVFAGQKNKASVKKKTSPWSVEGTPKPAKTKFSFGSWRKRLGLLFVSISLAGIGFFLSPYIAGKVAQNKRKGFAPLIAQEIERPEKPQVKSPVKTIDTPDQSDQPDMPEKQVIKSFYLTIEKIGLHSAPVIPEIDANNDNLYEKALRYGLVHAQNSALPNESGMTYIFGHSANYPWVFPRVNALFFDINKVEPGDKVKIEFNGEHFLYHVFDKKIVNPDGLDSVKANTNQDVLVLQSCYPPGTALKRLLIFAKPSKMGALIY